MGLGGFVQNPAVFEVHLDGKGLHIFLALNNLYGGTQQGADHID